MTIKKIFNWQTKYGEWDEEAYPSREDHLIDFKKKMFYVFRGEDMDTGMWLLSESNNWNDAESTVCVRAYTREYVNTLIAASDPEAVPGIYKYTWVRDSILSYPIYSLDHNWARPSIATREGPLKGEPIPEPFNPKYGGYYFDSFLNEDQEMNGQST